MISATNPKFFKKISQATTKLISSITDFEESDENHGLCKEFALSQFSHSKFLESDSHKIERRLKGLCEKFVIYSNPENAKILENLKSAFLQSDLTEVSQAKSNVHYDLLQIILDLSENPVNKTYVPPPPKIVKEEEQFDWKSYLLEGEELPYPSQWAFSDTPYGSDEDDDCQLISKEVVAKTSNLLRDEMPSPPSNAHQSFSVEIESQLVLPYWNAQDETVDTLKMSTDSEIIHIPTNSSLSENNIIREVLWVLAGCQELYLFPYVEGKHTVREIISCTHSSSKSLNNALTNVAKYADIVRKFEDFIFVKSSTECRTYQAFAESLLSYLKTFKNHLKKQEKIVLLQEETYLLSDLFKELSPKFYELDTVHSVFISSIDIDTKIDSHSIKACRLLQALYHIILDATSKDIMNISPFQNDLIKIWIDTLRPYFDIMDQWMTSGVLIDGSKEFVLQRSNSCPDVKSEQFWSTAFNLSNEQCLRQLPWLKPVLNDIVVCGKSVELLKSLGKPLKRYQNSSMFDDFVSKIFKCPKESSEQLTVVPKQDASHVQTSSDVMLQLNFDHLFTADKSPVKDHDYKFDGNTSLINLIHKSITGLVKNKLDHINEVLVNVFMVEYDLISLFRCFHKFHLMEWGDVMHDFSTSIFHKISNEAFWTDLMSLRASLQEAISDRDPESDYSFVAVAINRTKPLEVGHIHETDIVELIIDVNWPLNIVINDKTKVIYNLLFSYILQIKRARFCLQSLRFDTIMKSCDSQRTKIAHRLSLLRSSLLGLISQWHNFVMTSVIESEKNAFMECLKSVRNIDEVIVAHEKFLERITTLCLLKEEKQSEKLIQGTLRKIFDLAVAVHINWKRIETVTMQNLRKLESNYKECSEFLGVILLNLVSRGSVPLSLEALAFCLMT